MCCFIVTLLMIISLGPTDWVDTMETASSNIKDKEGLFRICPEILDDSVSVSPGSSDCRDQDKGVLIVDINV